jgi:murein DD-endopeptidase MepM/ murein hydrolase activator NlpD
MEVSMRMVLLIAASALVYGCTQAPAEVVHKGEQSFARDAASSAYPAAAPSLAATYNTYAPAAGGAAPPYASASAQPASVTARDLPPPARASAPPPAAAPQGWRSSFPATEPPPRRRAAFIRPVEGELTSRFGAQGGGIRHDGVIFTAREGEPVYASAGGTVLYTGSRIAEFGKMVIVQHADDRKTTYAHLSRIGVARGDTVAQGDILGYVGRTGDAKEPQLYFAVHAGTTPVDPERLFDSAHAMAR